MRRLFAIVVLLTVVPACANEEARTQIAELMRPGRVVVVGELHGTNEFPAAVADAATRAARRNLRVHVGLEIPADEHKAFSSYVDSEGQAKDRARLLRQPFWEGTDGRASEAMLRLIDHVRSLRSDGRKVDLLLFDLERGADLDPDDAEARDWRMARHIARAVREHPEDAFVVLVGSFHASRLETSTDRQEHYEPMVNWLVEDVPTVVNLLGKHAGGTAWTCQGEPVDCGVHRADGTAADGERTFVQVGGSDEGFDGSLFVGGVTASRPARSNP